MDTNGGGDCEGASQKPTDGPIQHTLKCDEESQFTVGDGNGEQAQQQKERVMQQTGQVLYRFVMERADIDNMPQDVREKLANEMATIKGSDDVCDDCVEGVALALCDIADGLDSEFSRNKAINEFMEKAAGAPQDEAFESFENACSKMLGDGRLSWGRIVVVFYFAYKLISSVTTATDRFVLIERIIALCLKYFLKHFLVWVIQHGGWKKIIEYCGTSSRVFFAILTASAVFGSYYWFFK